MSVDHDTLSCSQRTNPPASIIFERDFGEAVAVDGPFYQSNDIYIYLPYASRSDSGFWSQPRSSAFPPRAFQKEGHFKPRWGLNSWTKTVRGASIRGPKKDRMKSVETLWNESAKRAEGKEKGKRDLSLRFL